MNHETICIDTAAGGIFYVKEYKERIISSSVPIILAHGLMNSSEVYDHPARQIEDSLLAFARSIFLNRVLTSIIRKYIFCPIAREIAAAIVLKGTGDREE